MNFSESKDGILYAEVPTKGVKAIYPVIGDVLGWMSLVVMLGMIGWVVFGEKKVGED